MADFDTSLAADRVLVTARDGEVLRPDVDWTRTFRTDPAATVPEARA